MPLEKHGEVVQKARSLGNVRAINADKDLQAPAGPLARARVEVTFGNAEAIVAPDRGIWASIRRGLSTSVAGLAWSLQLIVIGLCFVLPWVLAIAVVGRTALFLALCWEWLAELWGLRNPLLTLRLDRRLVLAGSTALLIVAIPLSILAWQTWTAGYYDDSPLKPAYDFVARHDPAPAGRAAYVFADQSLYESFYPFFGRTADFMSQTLQLSTDQAERVIDDQARQFEDLKPYLVSRWTEMRAGSTDGAGDDGAGA